MLVREKGRGRRGEMVEGGGWWGEKTMMERRGGDGGGNDESERIIGEGMYHFVLQVYWMQEKLKIH